MKKICWFSTYPPMPVSSANTTYMLIEDLLKKKEFDINLITFKFKSINTTLPIKIYPILKRSSISSIVKLLLLIKKENYDIIHINFTKFMYGRLFLFIPFLIKNLLRIKSKIIISVHEFYEFSNIKELFIGGFYHLFLLRYSDVLLTFNNNIKKRILLKSIYKKNKENIIFISKNVQSLLFEKISPTELWSNKEIQPFILYFGFVRSNKGLDYLITALKRVHYIFPDLNLVIAGGIYKSGGLTKANAPNNYYLLLKKLISKLNLEDNIFFTGFISENEILELFKLAEVVIYPYLNIEQSGAIFSSLYLKKAIIATNILGFRQLLTHKKDCLLIKPKNSLEIARAIEVILKNNDIKKKLENGASQTYSENSFKKLVDKMAIIFNK